MNNNTVACSVKNGLKNMYMSSLDCYLVVCLEVLKLVLVALFLLVYDFGLVGQPVSQLWLLRLWFWLLEHLVEIRCLSSLVLIDRKVHRGLLCARLWNMGFLKNARKGFIRRHLAHFHSIRGVFLKLTWWRFEDDLVFREILVNRATEFLQFLCLLVALIKEHC